MKRGFATLLAFMMTVSVGWADKATRGAVTGLPLPRFVSIKAIKAHARRGPSLTHRIDWIYQRKGLPVIITAEYGHWRQVVDCDGQGGWIHYALLSGVRTVLVESEVAPMRVRPETDAFEVAILKQGVVARLDECTKAWCWLEAEKYEGWVAKDHLWGVKISEIIN